MNTSAPSTSASLGRANILFLVFHVAVLGSAVTWAGYHFRTRSQEQSLPALRPRPIEVLPQYDYDFIVTDEQLAKTLRKIRPRFDGPETKIFYVDHNLRAWTTAAKFNDPKGEFMSGQDMLDLLTDNRRFVEVYGPKQKPLLIDEVRGVRVRDKEGSAASSHTDHTLACLAEVGTPLDYPVITPTRNTTYRAILEQSLRSFSLNQEEYEWSALAFVLFLPPVSRWVTQEGQEMSFDLLADRIMREALPRGVCGANHRFHALVMFLRVDDLMTQEGQAPILSADTRRRIIAYLQEITATLVRHQHADGFWNLQWPDGQPASSKPSEVEGDRLGDRLIATGHVLEWWSLAPREIHPPREVMVRASQWLVRTVEQLTPQQTRDSTAFLSHAGRALALWRGRYPSEVDLNSETASEASESATPSSESD